MKIKVHAEDVFNFNRGATDIGSGAKDSDNGRFSELGWAKPFATHGELERTVTWTIGDPASADGGGGSEPARDVVGQEDRFDSGLPGPARDVLPAPNSEEGRDDS